MAPRRKTAKETPPKSELYELAKNFYGGQDFDSFLAEEVKDEMSSILTSAMTSTSDKTQTEFYQWVEEKTLKNIIKKKSIEYKKAIEADKRREQRLTPAQ